MFDFLRNLTKSDEEKRQERLSAYLDNALTPAERLAFEEELKQDAGLQASLEQQRSVKENLTALPRMRAPRNFTLDPAVYGRPTPAFAFRLYPVMRTATALAAVFLIFLFSLDLFSTSGSNRSADSQPLAQSSETSNVIADGGAAAELPAQAEPETFEAAGGEAESAVEEPAEEPMMEEAPAEEMAAEAETVGEAETAESAALEPAVTEGVVEQEEAADAYPAAAAVPPGESGLAATVEPEQATVTEDVTITKAPPSATATQRISQTTTTGDGVTALYSSTQTIDDNDLGTNLPGTASNNNRRLLQIGLGIVFLALLAGTWLLRRQL